MSSSRPQLLEDVPELMQLIQLRLPVEEAARTSVLSKSWLHAWSTISTLRFHMQRDYITHDTKTNMKLVDVDRTLTRYISDNIPIQRFELCIDIKDLESANLVENCIRTMATNNNSTLKEVFLSYNAGYCKWFTDLPLEILSCGNLTKLTILNEWTTPSTSGWMINPHLPVIINCVSLQELNLYNVNISQKLLDGILSSCKLLVKIVLTVDGSDSLGFNTIKVTNLPCLYHLSIDTGTTLEIKLTNLPCLYHLSIDTRPRGTVTLEINDVPNLHVFNWVLSHHVPFNSHSISLGSSLKELSLGNMVTYDAYLDMIESVAPVLESLTLDMTNWELGSFHFTCVSIKRLSLMDCPSKLTEIKVHASNLLFFFLDGETMPTLMFPLSTLIMETKFQLTLSEPVDVSFFLRMRAALAISSNCDLYVYMTCYIGKLSLKIDIGDLRTRVPSPRAMSVQRLFFQAECDKRVWERSSFIDALFEICHPNHVIAMQDNQWTNQKYFCKLMLTEVLEKKKTACWLRDLEHVQIRAHKKWETLTNSHKIFLKWPFSDQVDFKLEWR